MKTTLAVALTLLPLALPGSPIRTNPGFMSNSIAANDDGSGPKVPLGFTINFFGKQRSEAYVNNNGNITFDEPLATYTPFGLEGTQREIVAAFFADVDTRGLRSKLVRYGRDVVDGRLAFGANYIDVGYYNAHDDKLNRFQLIVIDRSDIGRGDFDIEFNYERIQWETGDASGGAGGTGGVSAAVGWSNGTGDTGTSFELTGSLQPGSFVDSAVRSLARTRFNSSTTGRYVFRARNGVLIPPLDITTACPLPPATAGAPYAQQLAGVGGSQPYRWSLVPDPGSQLPGGITLSPSGLLSGTPAAAGQSGFTLRLTSNTEDGEQTASRMCSLEVLPASLGITSACPVPPATVGQAYSTTLSAEGATGPYRWSLADPASLPPGLTLDAAGNIIGTPLVAGSWRFDLLVSAGVAQQVQPGRSSCGITVRPAMLDLTSGCTLPRATAGVPYNHDLSVSGGVAPYRWSLVGDLPAGLAISRDGRLSGLPELAGTFTFTARVQDATGTETRTPCTLAVEPPQFAVTTACPLPAASTGVSYSARLEATGGTAPYRWSILGAAPGGLTLSADGVLAGIPEAAGAAGFRVIATDASGYSASRTCSLLIRRSGYGLTGCPAPPATVGEPYWHVLGASGGTGPYMWNATENVPPGLTFGTSGRLAGTPSEPGRYVMRVQLLDSAGRSATHNCSVVVQPSHLQIANGCPLPSGRAGVPYTVRLQASGGAGPYSFSATGLPEGVALSADGAVSGTPHSAGDHRISIAVSDSQARSYSERCTLSIGIPEVPAMSLADVPPTLQAASTGPAVALELSRPYPLPISGTLVIGVTPDTGAAESALDRADPNVRFVTGGRSLAFTIPPGTTRFNTAIASTGTVASRVAISVRDLHAAGTKIAYVPGAQSFGVARGVPVITDACFSTADNVLKAFVTGYTTTRQLTSADFVFSSGAGEYKQTVDVAASSQGWFLSDESVRTGGAFTLEVPFAAVNLVPDTVSLALSNAEGSATAATLKHCR